MRTEMHNLIQSLSASDGGVICFVGAGGKKTTLYAISRQYHGRVALTSTSHMFKYDDRFVDRVIEGYNGTWVDDEQSRVVAFAGQTDTPNRVGGLKVDHIEEIWRSRKFGLLLIKADGARSLLVKAPAPYEPLIPSFANLVVPIASAQILGKPLTKDIAHRPELLAKIMGIDIGEKILPIHLALLLSSEMGSLKNVGNARVCPILNMVDDGRILALAIDAAHIALELTARFDQIILAEMRDSRIIKTISR
jgi:probable selenium-dependent hydroxylase accessory protein YqeC